MKVALYLKTFRKNNHLTQKEMAAKIEITREYYSRLENGVDSPSLNLLEKICSSTGYCMEKIINDDMNPDTIFNEMCEKCIMLEQKDRNKIMNIIKRSSSI